jgi:sugar phosphate isomerase/epimerase
MCLDIGHANLCDTTRNDFLRYMDEISAAVPIIHLHVHENYGDADSHLPLFTGPSGRDDAGIRAFLERLRKRDYSGAMILEQWPHPPGLLTSARDRLRTLLDGR